MYDLSGKQVGDVVEEECPVCKGTGHQHYMHNGVDYEEECTCCGGDGHIEIEVRECPECHKLVLKTDLVLVKDRYGIPYKYVCYDCYEDVHEELLKWQFDSSDAGEYLEEEDY